WIAVDRNSYQRSMTPPLLRHSSFRLSDHLVRSHQHLRWNRQADLLRGLEIDYEFEFRRLLHREIGRLGTLQDSVDIIGYAQVASPPSRETRSPAQAG